MHRRRWVVAAASVIAMGAGAALAMSEDDPGDAACDDVPLAGVPYDDDLPDLSEVEWLRIKIENLMIQGGEPYTEEDVDRALAEQLAAEELFPQPVAEVPIEVAESGLANGADIVNVIECDP